MPSAADALLQYEAGQDASPQTALTDSGDHIVFTSAASLWSRRSGFAPVVRPNGLRTGGIIMPAAAGGNNNVDVAALTCNLNGAIVTVAADTDVACTRATPTDTHIVNSITVNSSGAIAVVAGADGTAFSETRGADGGPPLIPTGSIEIGQVRFASNSAAAVASSEIYQVIGLHQERYDYPIWEEEPAEAQIRFAAALPLIHTGPVAKAVFASYADPVFADLPRVQDFVPPANAVAVNSQQIYGGTLGSTSLTLNAGSFTAFLNDGITDPLVKLENENLWFKFFPDRNESPHLLCQGVLGMTKAFPAGDNISAACTIGAESVPTRVET